MRNVDIMEELRLAGEAAWAAMCCHDEHAEGRPVSRVAQLRAALERSRDRVGYCQRQFDDYARTADLSTEATQRTHRKLAADLQRAIDDSRWIEKQLDDLMD